MKNSVELLIMELFIHIVCSYRVIKVPKSNYGQKDRYNEGNLRQLFFILNFLVHEMSIEGTDAKKISSNE